MASICCGRRRAAAATRSAEFDIQRRKAERTKISCYTLSQAELAQLHAQFELRIPFARIGVRRSACPTALVQSPTGVKDRVSRQR